MATRSKRRKRTTTIDGRHQAYMDLEIHSTWKDKLKPEYEAPYFKELVEYVEQDRQTHTIFPPAQLVFSAFDRCPFDQVKVVIIGQDPYHGPGQANGLCFSVNDGMKHPPSLTNIFKELSSDLEQPIPKSGDLGHWADQGVLMLNATLTVRAHQAGAHHGHGWERFTDAAIHKVATELDSVVFILWGSYAQKKAALVDSSRHYILKAPHPSPLSSYRGFFGSKPFSQANQYLASHAKNTINW